MRSTASFRRGVLFTFNLFFLFYFNAFAQVGINTTDPTTVLDVNGAFSLRESPIALTLINGVNADIDLGTTPYSQYSIEGPTAAFSIDGITSVGALADGQLVRLINTTDEIFTIVHNNTDALKILCPAEIDLILHGRNSSVTFQYNKTLARWTVSGYAKTSKTNNSQYAIGTSDISKNTATWQDITGLSITFSPENPTVFVTYKVFGGSNTSGFNIAEGYFRLVKDGTPIPNSYVKTGALPLDIDFQVSLPSFPVSVTPGVSTNITVQWWRNDSGTLINNASSNVYHNRYLTIID